MGIEKIVEGLAAGASAAASVETQEVFDGAAQALEALRKSMPGAVVLVVGVEPYTPGEEMRPNGLVKAVRAEVSIYGPKSGSGVTPRMIGASVAAFLVKTDIDTGALFRAGGLEDVARLQHAHSVLAGFPDGSAPVMPSPPKEPSAGSKQS